VKGESSFTFRVSKAKAKATAKSFAADQHGFSKSFRECLAAAWATEISSGSFDFAAKRGYAQDDNP
jgi:hypothetical protein